MKKRFLFSAAMILTVLCLIALGCDGGSSSSSSSSSSSGGCNGGSSSSSSSSSGGTIPNAKFVGNITHQGQIPSDFSQYWDQITCENEGKWASVEATRDVMNWSGIDRAYNYAKQHGLPYKQHTFVWGAQYPSWRWPGSCGR